jgi:hypothetical protein
VLGHHIEDSTHISYDVLTGGLTAGAKGGVRIEASGFHGRGPDEDRWDLQAGALDSWATRLAVAPGRNWSGQYSVGRLHSPEDEHPQQDLLRETASLSCHFGAKTALDGTALWGRNHSIGKGQNAQGLLLELTGTLRQRQWLWTRIEDVDRSAESGSGSNQQGARGRVQAYTGGYAHTLGTFSGTAWQIGGQFTGYSTPQAMTAMYGAHPWGVASFVRFQIGK